jgi:hypothetical protein
MVWQDGTSIALPEIGYPSGYYGRGFKLPLGKSSSTTKLQFLSGISAVVTFGGSAIGANGKPAYGSATLTITSSGLAKLIIAGVGSATLSINASADILAKLLAVGSATIEVSALGATFVGLGYPSGSATIILSSSALPRGIGWIDGTTGFTTTLTTQSIADAVWDEIMTGHVTADTYGKFVQKLLSVSKFMGLK